MKHLTLGVALLMANVCASADPLTYTALADENQIPVNSGQQKFYCSDQVFAVVEVDDYEPGEHQLHVRWFSPAGEMTESTRYKFLVLNDYERVWAWLKLHRQSGAGVLRWIDSSAGMEGFIGPWQVTIEIDGNQVSVLDFEVMC